MSESEQESTGVKEDREIADQVEPETGRPRSSSVIGGRRSPLDEDASMRAGTLDPTKPQDNEERTGKKISQWGTSARRRSYWKNRYY